MRTHAADLKIEQPPDTNVRGYGTYRSWRQTSRNPWVDLAAAGSGFVPEQQTDSGKDMACTCGTMFL